MLDLLRRYLLRRHLLEILVFGPYEPRSYKRCQGFLLQGTWTYTRWYLELPGTDQQFFLGTAGAREADQKRIYFYNSWHTSQHGGLQRIQVGSKVA